ncbi:hypothetical protein N9B82_03050 [Saprospiraceae bacterium]|nr:hypothetical protein [Saprospiraceae bacterium]
MQVKVHLNKLILKQTFTISHGSYNDRDQMIVELSAKNFSGFGETVAIDYYKVNIENLMATGATIKPTIESLDTSLSPKEFYKELLRVLPKNPFLRAAFDCAFYQLKAKIADISLREYLGISEIREVESCITIGITDSKESINAKLKQEWPFFKIKVNADEDREGLMKIISDSGRSFGVDANGSLSLRQAQKMIDLVAKYDGTYVEQLMHKESRSELHKLILPKTLPHLADESVTDLQTAKELCAFYDGFVLKLTKSGGITPVMEIIKLAKSKNKKLLAGCMTESSIGINNMLALLPLFDFADLDGAYLINNDKTVTSFADQTKRILQENGKFV